MVFPRRRVLPPVLLLDFIPLHKVLGRMSQERMGHKGSLGLYSASFCTVHISQLQLAGPAVWYAIFWSQPLRICHSAINTRMSYVWYFALYLWLCSFQKYLHLFTDEIMKDRFTKYFLPEYSSHVYSDIPGVQGYTHVSRWTSDAFPLWYMKENRVSLSPIFYVSLC